MRKVSYGVEGSRVFFYYYKLLIALKKEYPTTILCINSFYRIHYKLELNNIILQEKFDLLDVAQFTLTYNPLI